MGVTRPRNRRVCTRRAKVGSSPAEVYEAIDPESCFGVLYRKILDAARGGGDGVVEAREILFDWLASLVAKHAREIRGPALDTANDAFDASAVVDGGLSRSPDAREALTKIPRWIHAALATSSALAVPGFTDPRLPASTHTADGRVAAFFAQSRRAPRALVRCLYPEITSWDRDDATVPRKETRAASSVVSPGEPKKPIRASREASVMSDGFAFAVDAEDSLAVFYAPCQPGTETSNAPFPPAWGSNLRAFVERARGERRRTPTVSFIRGGVEDSVAFDRTLVEDLDVVGIGGETSSGLEQFKRAVETRARAFLREETV